MTLTTGISLAELGECRQEGQVRFWNQFDTCGAGTVPQEGRDDSQVYCLSPSP